MKINVNSTTPWPEARVRIVKEFRRQDRRGFKGIDRLRKR
jgi:hypothetical protein